MIVLEERRVAVDFGVKAFADDHVGPGGVKGGVERGTFAPLNAVIGPQDLGAVGHVDHAHRGGVVGGRE